MVSALSYAVIVTALLFSVVVLVYVALDRIPDWTLLGLAGFVEALTVVLIGASIVQLVSGDQAMDGAEGTTYFGYLATAIFALPVGFFWSLAEKSRAATAVLAAAALTHAFLVVRTLQIWGAA